MRFNPKTEQEIQSMNVAPEGRYPFEVIGASDDVSKTSGNEMIKLVLKIWDSLNREVVIFDYLLESMAFKLKHFCDATGLEEKYANGTLEAGDCLGMTGYLDLIIQKDKTGKYADKNAVKDYIVEKVKAEKGEEVAFQDDDIPF